MKIGMHIFPVCMQDVYKCIHASRVTYERLAHVHSPNVHIFQQYLQHNYVSILVRRDVREAQDTYNYIVHNTKFTLKLHD